MSGRGPTASPPWVTADEQGEGELAPDGGGEDGDTASTTCRRRSRTATGVVGRPRRRRPGPANAAALTRWARDYQEALHPYSAGGADIDFMMEEGADRIRASYRGNYDRLARIKRRYDPDILFRTNRTSSPPATSSRPPRQG